MVCPAQSYVRSMAAFDAPSPGSKIAHAEGGHDGLSNYWAFDANSALSLCTVEVPSPDNFAAFKIPTPDCNILLAVAVRLSSISARPICLPAARALAIPALVRATIISRLNSLNTASIPNMARPTGVVVSSAGADGSSYRITASAAPKDAISAPTPPGRRRSAKKGEAEAQTLGRSRGGFSSKLHVVVDALGPPVRFAIDSG